MKTNFARTLPKTFPGESQPAYRNHILETIGNTPLVRLNRIVFGSSAATVLAKVELFNPAGSIKDRIGAAIIENAEREGRLHPGGTIVEATSGNTGAGLALAATIKGYRCVFVMPDKMSDEKVRFLRAFGARVVITPTAVGPEDPRSYYNVAARIVKETPNSVLANQYYNAANPEAHYRSTGPEIWTQTAGKIDVLVAGMGTGGTISGTARYLKEQNPSIQVVGVDIEGSLLFETWQNGQVPTDPHPKTYKIEGIGEDFLPGTLDLALIDEVVQVSDAESFQMARRLVREEGIFAGGSSGSAVAGLLKSNLVRALKPGQIAVVILPDSGFRYLSKIYDDNWMRENGFLPSPKASDTVTTLLKSRTKLPLIVSKSDEAMNAVVEKMNRYDISQLPVVDGENRLIGMISESDLLDHLLRADHVHDPTETISPIVNPNVLTTPEDAKVESVLPAFERGKVVIITTPDGLPVGMLTKIDIIDYLTEKIE
ncbi:MAG: pyridoxal-phosphate dependent enzyme [Anaerolineaceae bacterium]|nr:pyridoxal-phosphate dependent enzyme [Anaerolineaceae bacterium]